jgi:dTDP-3-amino-3,4,6-trideoxy-alpha-D-glucose transaminase
MMTPIPFLDLGATYLEQQSDLDAAYVRVMRSGRWILGDELSRFETEFAVSCGSQHCVGVGNGLDALYLALEALGIGTGDEVVVPAHTFVATWIAILRCGATPVPVEPTNHPYLALGDSLLAAMTPRTRAIVPVHLYGEVIDLRALGSECHARGIHIVEDAAQTHGVRLGNRGDAICYSFYPGKNLGSFGDGGAIVTSDPALAEKLRAIRNYGSLERYRHDFPGINSRLDELQAAFLRVKLSRLDDYNGRRAAVAAVYGQELPGIGDLQLPADPGRGRHTWHLYVVQTAHRDALQEHLRQHGCETLVHYPTPIYRMLPYMRFGPTDTTATDRLSARILSLPMGPHLSLQQAHEVCELIREFFARR